MLDSPDIECRLLGWKLLRECTDLYRDATLIYSYNERKEKLKFLLETFDSYTVVINENIASVSYSSLIRDFTTKSKIYFGKDYLTLRNGRTSQ